MTTKDLYLYGSIGVDVDANKISSEVSNTPEDSDIVIHISSPGGDVYSSIALMNSLRSFPGHVTAIIEGLAASAASFVAIGGADKVLIRPGAEIMVHNAWTQTAGNSAALIKAAKDLERLSLTIAEIYSEKSGGSVEAWLEAMTAETWFKDQEAVDAGIVDEVADGKKDKNLVGTLSAQNILETYQGRHFSPDCQKLSGGLSMDFLKEISNKLGAQETLDESGVLALLDEVLNEQVTEETEDFGVITIEYPETEAEAGDVEVTPVADPKFPEGTTFEVEGNVEVSETGVITATLEDEDIDYVVSVTLPDSEPIEVSSSIKVAKAEEEENPSSEDTEEPATTEEPSNEIETVTLDKSTFDDLKQAAELGWKAKKEADKKALAEEVDFWISEGRISSSRRAEVLGQMESSPETVRGIYSSIPAGTIPRGEAGYSVVDEEENTDNKTKEQLFSELDKLFKF